MLFNKNRKLDLLKNKQNNSQQKYKKRSLYNKKSQVY